ncbi:MAG: hypothetical protein ABI402_19045 [Ferruginibacter sp.]
MKAYFIKSIQIEGFRGINNNSSPLKIIFKPNGVTSIFGENGKGKSSIFEAFVFAILGRIIRFDDYHSDIKDRNSIKNLFHASDGKIKIEFINELNNVIEIDILVDANGERTVNSTSVSNPNLFLATLCNKLNFLDHKSFEKIIISSAEDTGKLFSNLVGFSKFIDIKEKLDKISRTQNINTDFNRSQKEKSIIENEKKITQLIEQIKEKLESVDVTINSYDKLMVLEIVKKFINKSYGQKIKKVTIDSNINFDLLIRNKVGLNYEADVSKLTELRNTLNNTLSLSKSVKSFNSKTVNSLSDKLKIAYLEIESDADILLGKLYEKAIDSYDKISEVDKNNCILCDTTSLNKNEQTFYDQIKNKIKLFNKFKSKYSVFYNLLVNKIEVSQIKTIEKLYANDDEKIFSELKIEAVFFSKDFFESNNIQTLISAYVQKIEISKANLLLAISELNKKLPPKLSEFIELNNVYKSIFDLIVEIDNLQISNNRNTKYLFELESWTKFIGEVKDSYENSYNILMDEIALNIDSDTKSFFKDIMGNVEITPKLKKDNRGQKVNILLEKFYSNTSELRAAPILSESYRNALSLSIYFASALRSKSLGNFIILDDITSSFDSGHQIHLLELIKRKICISSTNKKGKQIIFLTHDGLLKKLLNENGALKDWQHYVLNSNKDIVSISPLKSDDLKLNITHKINSGNYLGSDFRMYYEFVLLEIIEKLDLEVPFSLIYNNDTKMVSKLSNAIHEIIELKRLSRKAKSVFLRLPNKSDFKSYVQQLTNNLSHWGSGREISLSTPVLNKIIDDIDDFKKQFQYNCTCPAKNIGWVYFNSLSSPKHKGCNCSI